jgi:hypothetical protein
VTARAGAAVGTTVLGVALLTGCSGDPHAALAADVRQITADANARRADAVRTGVDRLVSRVDAEARSGALTSAQAAALRRTALAVRSGADAVDADLIARRKAEQAAADAQRRVEQAQQAARDAAAQAAAQAAQAAAQAAAPKPDDGKGKGGHK